MSKFYPLKVSDIHRETPDAVSLEFEIPAEYSKEFQYKQGQYLTFKITLEGEEIRRSYSLCSAPSADKKLKVAIKEVQNGRASGYINRVLKPGDIMEAMPPMGNFYAELNAANKKHYVGIVAGSGITPVLSILKETLLVEKDSKFTLIYSNKNTASVIFHSEIEQLSKTYPSRLDIVYVYSRENLGNPLFFGRLEKEKINQILREKKADKADHYFICGPEEMIINSNEVLTDMGIPKTSIHFELFTTPVKMHSESKAASGDFSGESKVTVTIDGITTDFMLNTNGMSVLDAAMKAGADAPFSCKGAVCCTCKAKVIKGKAFMDMNYALTDNEVEQGFILSCQAHPCTSELVVDFDVA